MFIHYLSLAWDQLKKYRLQSAVSIVSLAIGFTCFAMATMWIRYERTYDGFHKDADGIYALLDNNQRELSFLNKQEFDQWPEISEYSIYSSLWSGIVNGQEVETYERLISDSSYLSIFHIDFIEGGNGFLYDEGQVAISDQLAKRLWGDESPIGKELCIETEFVSRQRRVVTGVFKSWGEHTNFPFEILGKYPTVLPNNLIISKYCVMRLHPHVNVDTLNARLKNYEFSDILTADGKPFTIEAKVVPVTQLRHSTIGYKRYAKFKVEHIYLFSCASLLLIVCGLLNYLTIFINRLFIRKREIALRRVFGASNGHLMTQFLVEYGLVLVIAMFLGFLVLDASLDWFFTLSELPHDLGFIYGECFIYMAVVIGASLLVSMPFITYFRRQSLQIAITGVGGLAHYNIFRRISTGFQIGIAIFSIFCVAVMLKQLDTLRHDDIGFARENRAYQYISGSVTEMDEQCEALTAFLRQMPEVDTAFVPKVLIGGYSVQKLYVEDFPQLDETLEFYRGEITEEMARFAGMTLLQGEWPDPYKHSPNDVVINATFARHMGWDNPIGEQIKTYKVVGVYKDVFSTPTQRANPRMLTLPNEGSYSLHLRRLLFKFKPGTFPIIRQKIEEFYKEKEWSDVHYTANMLEEVYEEQLESELNLQKLLNIITSVCILIALFGVWSMIMLTCEQRRKEIAVRKVFGATTKDILDMFFIEYISLQGIAAIVAFPIGYACMKPWLEQYVVQTEISWWIYVGIFFAVTLLVAVCIGWRVWKTAKAKPADEIK